MGQLLPLRTLGPLLLFTVALPLQGQADRSFVGPQACAKCHTEIHHQWAQSLHSKMMQPASELGVKGDFSLGKITIGGAAYVLQHRNGKYYITESSISGKPVEHRVDYTLGSHRVQHYLTTLAEGRIVVLPATWDMVDNKWVDVADIGNPEEALGVQIWNKSCYGCHVSGEKKNFDVQNARYQTTWRSLSIDCEVCHGPGSEHVAKATSTKTLSKDTRAAIDAAIINPARLDPLRSTMICAQCHSFRDIYRDGFKAGANYYDFFQPMMDHRLPTSDDPAYWPDGRGRWTSNETLALWQSPCFLKGGATCTTCHSQSHNIDVVRDPKLRPNSNELCAQCHAQIAAKVSAHTHHAPNSAGSSCVECHMPRVVAGVRAAFRDHSMSIPVPENTITHNIPNACNLCHRDKDANWALQQMNAWYSGQSRQKFVVRADAFTAARSGDAAAIPALLQLLSDPAQGPVIRANAAGYLGSFPDDPSAYHAVFHAFSDLEPLVRATATLAIRPRAAQRAAVAPALVTLLRDPIALVQFNAAVALVGMGVRDLPPEDAEWFENGKKLYRARAELNSDDAQQQFAAGRFFYLSGHLDDAVAAFRSALKLDPNIPAQYYLAQTLVEKGDFQSAREILKTIPPNDRQYASAQQLLSQIEAKQSQTAAGNPNPNATEAEARFRNGQTLYQNGNYGGALKELDDAIRLSPQASWATKAQIYRAVCLEKLSHTQEAEAAMQALSGNSEAHNDADLQLAYVELLYETGRREEALKRIDDFIAAAPKVPMAYFWQAKVLLQLDRADEAAKAAEESIRLLPDLAEAHNLLIRIYQMQGRTAEAAQQAQWVKDYERRMQAR